MVVCYAVVMCTLFMLVFKILCSTTVDNGDKIIIQYIYRLCSEVCLLFHCVVSSLEEKHQPFKFIYFGRHQQAKQVICKPTGAMPKLYLAAFYSLFFCI